MTGRFGVTGGTPYRQTGQMMAVSYSAPQTLPVLGTRPDPDCPRDGAVLRVRATGVCRSDWHAWMGHDPVALPHVPGHELAGDIASVGDGVLPGLQQETESAPGADPGGWRRRSATGRGGRAMAAEPPEGFGSFPSPRDKCERASLIHEFFVILTYSSLRTPFVRAMILREHRRWRNRL